MSEQPPIPRSESRIDDPPEEAYDLPEPDGVGSVPGRVFERWENEYRVWRKEELWFPPEDGDYENAAVILYSGPHRMIVDADELGARLSAEDSRWLAKPPHLLGGRGLGPNPNGSWPLEHVDIEQFKRSYAPIEQRIAPRNARDLELEKFGGRGSRTRANKFLSGDDGLVDPSKGEVQGWKACFTARGPTGDLLGLCIVGRPRARVLDNGEALEVYRLAAHPIAPSNTNSALIGKARRWARNDGYDRLLTYANLDEQEGTCYDASGLTLEETTEADPKGWKRHGDDRKETEPEPWTRGRFEVAL